MIRITGIRMPLTYTDERLQQLPEAMADDGLLDVSLTYTDERPPLCAPSGWPNGRWTPAKKRMCISASLST